MTYVLNRCVVGDEEGNLEFSDSVPIGEYKKLQTFNGLHSSIEEYQDYKSEKMKVVIYLKSDVEDLAVKVATMVANGVGHKLMGTGDSIFDYGFSLPQDSIHFGD